MKTTMLQTTTLKLTGPAERFQISYHGDDAVIRIRAGEASLAQAIAFELHSQLDAGTARLTIERA